MKKNTKIILIAFISLILIGFIGGFINTSSFFSGLGLSSIGSTGFSVNSISTVPIISNPGQNTNFKYLVNATLGGGQTIVGTLSPTDFQNNLGFSSIYPLEIDVTRNDERVIYNSTGTAVPIYKYSVDQRTIQFLQAPPPCPSNAVGGKMFLYQPLLQTNYRYCILKTQTGSIYPLTNPAVVFDADIRLVANGVSISKNITTIDPSATFTVSGVEYARVSWVGSLVSGSPVPNPNNVRAFYLTNSNTWIIVPSALYDRYISSSPSQFEAQINTMPTQLSGVNLGLVFPTGFSITQQNLCTSSGGVNCTQMFQLMFDGINSSTDRLVSGNTTIDGVSYSNAGSSTSTGKFGVILPNRIQFPAMNLLVNASWLGVRVPVLTNATISRIDLPTNFLAGQSAQFNVYVNNNSSVTGNAYVAMSGCSFTQLNNNSTTLQANSQNVPFFISLQNVQSTSSQSCVFQLKNDSGTVLDSETATISFQQAGVCSPGATQTLGLCYQVCGASGQWNGAGSICCGANQILITSPTPQCQDRNPNPDTNQTPTPDQCAGIVPTPGLDYPLCGICSEGKHLVAKNSPNYLLWVIPQGTTTTASCEPNSDYTIAIIAVAGIVAVLIGFLLTRKKKRGT